jgi:hypothetical protein
MKMRIFTRWLAVWLLASFCLSSAILGNGASITRQRAGALADDPRLDMVRSIQAVGPHPSLADPAKIFDGFVGSWNVEYTDFSKDGKPTHRTGELLIGWVMDGRAMQDFWIVYPSGARTDREVYTALRYYDRKSATWPMTFIDPEHAGVTRFTGAAVGEDRIAFDTRDFNGADTRWSLNDIRSDSFVWREEESLDGGKTWRLLAQHHMKRRGAAPSAPGLHLPPTG